MLAQILQMTRQLCRDNLHVETPNQQRISWSCTRTQNHMSWPILNIVSQGGNSAFCGGNEVANDRRANSKMRAAHTTRA